MERRDMGGYISILPRGKTQARELEQLPQVMEQGRAKGGTHFPVAEAAPLKHRDYQISLIIEKSH